MSRKLLAVTLAVSFAALTLIIVAQNLNADDISHSDGYRSSTTATGGKDHNLPIFRAWADYLGKLYRDASVDKVSGEYDLVAFVAGGSNPNDAIATYTLKKRKVLFLTFGDEAWKHHYDSASWSGTNPYAYSRAKGKCGKLTNKTEKWNS